MKCAQWKTSFDLLLPSYVHLKCIYSRQKCAHEKQDFNVTKALLLLVFENEKYDTLCVSLTLAETTLLTVPDMVSWCDYGQV